ncbi:MAG TPA: RNA methyltransferase, partial [Bacteroidota bacterium]|nr:RNA methyltransferase [Bacteroidota bacterium]
LNKSGLEPYQTLRQTADHRDQGIFVAEGDKVVARLLERPDGVVSFLMTPEWLDVHRSVLESLPGTVAVFVAEKSLLNTIVGFHLHQGIMAVAKIPEPANLGTLVTRSKRPFLLVAVDGITNSENLGVLVRNCAAFGVQGLVVGETSSSPYLRRAVRNSMGTIFRLPVVNSENLAATLRELSTSHSVRVIAAHPHTEHHQLSDMDFRRDCCIVFGSEGTGISAGVLAACDESAAIPMAEGVDSLNVSNASAVFLYEVARQRGAKTPLA